MFTKNDEEKIRKLYPNVKITNILNNNANGAWHPHITVQDQCGNFSIQGMLSGCGSALFYGFFMNKPTKELVDLIKLIFEYYKKNGVGSILATAGQSISDKLLLDLNFKQLSEYPNYRHGLDYKQRLYQLIL